MSTQEFEAWLAPLVEQAEANKSQNGNIITIPVVVHVIHTTQFLSTNEVKNETFGIYPNPAADVLNITKVIK